MPTPLLAALLLSAAPLPAALPAAAPDPAAPPGPELAAAAAPGPSDVPAPLRAAEPVAPAAPRAAPAPGAPPARSLDLAGAPALGRSLAAPGLLLAALAAAALLLARRRRATGRHVEVLETTSLGPRRALVLARVGDEVLLLGSSEAGLALLRALPAAATAAAAAPLPPPSAAPPPLPARTDLLARLRGLGCSGEPAPAPGFEALLAESAEDQELRRKLARGQSGSVR
ncbi:flagellar biosynthesis protein FliO [Anaeromyxobacter dehalogenans 2CP-1]|uniref:Flagellar biosynthesis protein FliO n=1 Tax=Anaeromyxobacter dehalogenans (strain ATCC BAA-258 / DSM 21875 / 2CP-1) TaxID=455488 RepID=B8JD78_ANAD2|nr:flagellar biosynthetic protein FliO [Anaeromyxobacter dehalogenans]ACL65927.1 flagellar biosynthesis protein FliO [Anaeromyxobacter dehalogenans 2CP-1]